MPSRPMFLNNLTLVLPALGFLIGLLIGLTGVGGGVLMRAILIKILGGGPENRLYVHFLGHAIGANGLLHAGREITVKGALKWAKCMS